MKPLTCDNDKNFTGFNPRKPATTELAPSHPIKTCDMIGKRLKIISYLKKEAIKFSSIVSNTKERLKFLSVLFSSYICYYFRSVAV